MSGYLIGSFLLYVFLNAFTPGPGNLLALNTVTTYGKRRGRPLFFGILTGYYVVQILCAIFVFGVSAFLPSFLGVLRYIGAAYILWLAWHIASSKPETDSDGKSASFLKGFLLQLVNVKIWMFGISALSGYIAPVDSSFPALLLAELFIATIGSLATITWITVGDRIKDVYRRHFRLINVILAFVLLECVYSILTVRV